MRKDGVWERTTNGERGKTMATKAEQAAFDRLNENGAPLLCCVCHDTNAVGNDGAMLAPDRFVCTDCVRRLVDAHG